MKKVLIFSTAYYPFVGGAEVAVKEITDRLGSDFEFDLITAKLQKDLPNIEKVGAVTVYRVGFGNPFFDKLLLPFRGILLIKKLHKTQSYYCFWGIMASFASGSAYLFNIFRVLTFQKKIPMILTLQEGDSENHLQYKWAGLITLSWRLALWNTNHLTAISNFLLNRAKKHGYSGESMLIPNGVDLPLFSEEITLETKTVIKNRLGKKDGDIFLVTTGRLTHKNGIDDVISALQLLPTNVIFIIIGKGDLGPHLQEQARKLGVADRVKFLGFVPYVEIPKYLSVCDIFIRPSRSEGFGNSFIEAMAAGLPVIATPVGGIVDFIDDNETGVFCSPDNPKSIADAVTHLIKGVNLKEKVIEQARSRVRERYSWEVVSGEMKKVFDLVS